VANNKKEAQENNSQDKKAQRCLRWLNLSLIIGLVYAISLIISIAFSMMAPGGVFITIGKITALIWPFAKLGFAVSLVCLYQATGHARWALAGILLALSALLPWFLTNPESQILLLGIEALAVTALSLSLFDLGRAANLSLETPAGLIFLGVILQILQNPLMAFVGIVFLTFGFYLTLKRTWVSSSDDLVS